MNRPLLGPLELSLVIVVARASTRTSTALSRPVTWSMVSVDRWIRVSIESVIYEYLAGTTRRYLEMTSS